MKDKCDCVETQIKWLSIFLLLTKVARLDLKKLMTEGGKFILVLNSDRFHGKKLTF